MPRPVWTFPLALDPAGGEPLFRQVAQAVVHDIRRGRLRPGDPLPGSRSLAETLKVHRNTVLAAYDELVAEGWLEPSRARGTFVSKALPDAPPRHFSPEAAARDVVPRRAGFDLAPAPYPRDRAFHGPSARYLMTGGIPDVRLAPAGALARAYRRALRGSARDVLSYGDARGHRRLRAALAAMLAASRGLASREDDVLVVRGSQMALDLAARALVRPGDAVGVEGVGYRPAWEAFRRQGAQLVPLPVDEHGLVVDALATALEATPLRAVYVTPHHHYPTTVTLSAPRRLQLLELARRHRFAIVEDDYDHEFHYEGRPVLPLASADQAGVVVYIGTLAKILAPGLRLGYLVAPPDVLERMADHRFYVDRQGDATVEHAVAQLLEDGEVQRHARRVRRAYLARRDALVAGFRRTFADVLSFEVPGGGMALWTAVARDVDPEAWARGALARNVLFLPGRAFRYDGRASPHARFGFAALDEGELADAVRRLSRALAAARKA